jgi:hypothetical protein
LKKLAQVCIEYKAEEGVEVNKSFPSYDDVEKARSIFKEIAYEHWLNDDLLTWKWWLILGLTIIPWIIWWKIVDRSRRQEIFVFGLIIGILAMILDNLGTDFYGGDTQTNYFRCFLP